MQTRSIVATLCVLISLAGAVAAEPLDQNEVIRKGLSYVE